MEKEEYRIALAKLEWTQRRAARELGFHERTSRKYALGESPIPETVAILVRIRLAQRKDERAQKRKRGS
jgi:hypothetical protein